MDFKKKMSSLGKSLLTKHQIYFRKGETKSYEWRVKQLKQLRKLIVENDKLVLKKTFY